MSNSELEEFAKIKLPTSARDVRTFTQIGQGRMLVLRFEMGAAELPVFLQQSGFPGQLREDYRPPGFNKPTATALPWWDVATAQRPTGTEDWLPNGTNRQLVVARPGPDVVVAYMNVIKI